MTNEQIIEYFKERCKDNAHIPFEVWGQLYSQVLYQRAKEEERERNIETVNRAYLRISPELRLDKDIKEILKNVVEETKNQIIKYIKQ